MKYGKKTNSYTFCRKLEIKCCFKYPFMNIEYVQKCVELCSKEQRYEFKPSKGRGSNRVFSPFLCA